MENFHDIGVVFSKEVRDNLRDKRSVISALASALFGPLLLVGMILLLGRSVFNESSQRAWSLPVVGAENAPALINFLESQNVQVLPAPDDPRAAVAAGEAQVVLVIPTGYEEAFSQGRPATVQMVVDRSRQSDLVRIEQLQKLLNAYSTQMASLRLMARGINPMIISPLAIEQVDLATPESQSLLFLNMLPYFIVLVIFVGGMYVIIDATAGERERNSLEPLLINPIARRDLVLGKLLAAVPFATLAVFLALMTFYLAFNLIPIEEIIGMPVALDFSTLVGIFFIALPMIFLASALQMIVATFTRSFKEAQTYVAFLPLVPALPGLGLVFLSVRPTLVNMLIPTFGQQILINQLMRGEALNPLFVALNTLVTVFVAGLLIAIAIRLYQRERILFGVR